MGYTTFLAISIVLLYVAKSIIICDIEWLVREICVYHKAKKESIRGYYIRGQKRSQACEIFRVERIMVSLLCK
jgi:hypothetical protein